MQGKKQANDLYDVATLTISNDPFVGRLRQSGSKYDEIFGKLKIGQRIICHSDAAARLSSQLKQWLEKRGHKNPVVRAVAHYHDGKGGVWWLEAEGASKGRASPKTTWADLARKVA
jgi:hypothetical protein